MASARLAAALVCALLFRTSAAAAEARCGPDNEACPATAASGSAMLQTGADKRTTSAGGSIEGRVATLDAELTSLENRVGILMSIVGLQGGAALLSKAGSYDRYKALLKNKYDEAAIVDVVSDLETQADDVKSKITSVEDEVSGSQIVSLLDKAKEANDSLTNRVTALEEVVSSIKDRTKAMEAKVTGMASKAL